MRGHQQTRKVAAAGARMERRGNAKVMHWMIDVGGGDALGWVGSKRVACRRVASQRVVCVTKEAAVESRPKLSEDGPIVQIHNLSYHRPGTAAVAVVLLTAGMQVSEEATAHDGVPDACASWYIFLVHSGVVKAYPRSNLYPLQRDIQRPDGVH